MTKSEIWGLFLCFAEIDSMREGVASLFSEVERNGYQLMYLTARPIPSVKKTRSYLSDHRDEGDRRKKLPEGPVITSCHGFRRTAWRHLTLTSRTAFKTPCLQKIKELFSVDTNPFYAGFGDKESDIRSYLAVGISERSIFVAKGRAIILYANNKEYVRFAGYDGLQKCFDIFPPRKGYQRVDQGEDNLNEEPLTKMFPNVTQLPRDSDSHRRGACHVRRQM